jgi:hypothetical protein
MTANKRNNRNQPLRRQDPRRQRSGEKGTKVIPVRPLEKVPMWWDRPRRK